MTFSVEPSPVVIDASFAVEVVTGNDASAIALGEAISSLALVLVPAHFWVELANALLRSRHLAAAEVSARIARLEETGIGVADRGPLGLLESISLADRHRLTVYDATYLQLALDVDAQLATFDDALRRAAVAEETPLLI